VVRYFDTPGIGDPNEAPGTRHWALEKEGQDLALAVARGAELVLMCADSTVGFLDAPGESQLVVKVGLRSDLGAPPAGADVAVSARTGENLDVLTSMVRDALVSPEMIADPGPWKFW
jgi:hypothetical protein